jgi:DNA-binding NarL/FixJ family response regulator
MDAEVLIIGAGPAGLAVAASLKRKGRQPLVIEKATQVGASWRNHYTRLHLHTVKALSALPGLPFPDAAPRYVPRQGVVDYLAAYAAKAGIEPCFGEEATEIVRAAPGVRVLILSMHDNEQYFFEALRAGASGYVLKSAVDRDLVEGCRATMRGEPFFYAGAVRALIREHLEAGEVPALDDPLTPREGQVVKLIAEGNTTREIAELLVISERTVERHRENILEKLHMRDRVELTRYAIRRGLIEA